MEILLSSQFFDHMYSFSYIFINLLLKKQRKQTYMSIQSTTNVMFSLSSQVITCTRVSWDVEFWRRIIKGWNSYTANVTKRFILKKVITIQPYRLFNATSKFTHSHIFIIDILLWKWDIWVLLQVCLDPRDRLVYLKPTPKWIQWSVQTVLPSECKHIQQHKLISNKSYLLG